MQYPQASPPKLFDYDAFVAEIERMSAEALLFSWEDRNTSSHAFRKWRLRLEDLLRRVHHLGYTTTCDLSNRTFVAFMGEHEDSDAVFEEELTDTLQELDLIVENFSKYGDPGPTKAKGSVAEPSNAVIAAPKPQPLLSPERVTIGWLLHNVSMTGWGTIVALLLAVFTAGTYLGKSPLFRATDGKGTASQASQPAPAVQAKPAAK